MSRHVPPDVPIFVVAEIGNTDETIDWNIEVPYVSTKQDKAYQHAVRMMKAYGGSWVVYHAVPIITVDRHPNREVGDD